MLTLHKLKDTEPDTIMFTGKTVDSPDGINMANTGRELRWVAVRGTIHDWAIYIHESYHSKEYIKQLGDKVTDEHNIKKLVPCEDEAFEMYRY